MIYVRDLNFHGLFSPTTAITEPSLRLFASQSYRHSDNASGFKRSNNLRNVSLSGIPFGNSRNCLNHVSRSFPKSSISSKSSPLSISVHSSIIMISSSLCRMFPRSVRRGLQSESMTLLILLSSYLYFITFLYNFKCCCPGCSPSLSFIGSAQRSGHLAAEYFSGSVELFFRT